MTERPRWAKYLIYPIIGIILVLRYRHLLFTIAFSLALGVWFWFHPEQLLGMLKIGGVVIGITGAALLAMLAVFSGIGWFLSRRFKSMAPMEGFDEPR